MSTMVYIKRHIGLTPIGQPFSTRDCLKYGTRSAVDNALYICVKKKVIVRLTYGVFMRADHKTPFPSPMALVRIKARAFGKVLVEHSADLAYENGFVDKGNQSPTFYVNASSSSFQYGSMRVYLRTSSNKRMHMKDKPAGQVIRSLWYLGADCLHHHAEQAIMKASSPDIRRQLVLSKAWMPAWLARFFPTKGYPCPPDRRAYDAHFTDYFEGDSRVVEEALSWPYQSDKFSSAYLQDFALACSQ